MLKQQLPVLVSQLLNEGYVEVVNGNYLFTTKFSEDLKLELFKPTLNQAVSQVPESAVTLWNKQTDWPLFFMNFIKEAAVPARLETRSGDAYYANKYSEPAMKVFRKALEKEGVNYTTLLRSTTLYYKSSVGYKKTIGNYFVQGDWRTDYIALEQAMRSGAKELTDHITEQVKAKHDKPTNFTIG